MKIEPSNGPYLWVMTTFQTSSKETWTILAPYRLMACNLVSGALSGTIAEQGIPFCLACQARACAMFPALQVYTPRDFAAGPANAMALQGSSNFERARGLQVFKLQIDLHVRVNVQSDNGGPQH